MKHICVVCGRELSSVFKCVACVEEVEFCFNCGLEHQEYVPGWPHQILSETDYEKFISEMNQ